ncbi:MAG: BamA/TamA family outer membrane protein [Gemmatimonadetes bacterium]|nr:BamA/TamA family outer membrane protein [Gemmatimonadota bacterium]
MTPTRLVTLGALLLAAPLAAQDPVGIDFSRPAASDAKVREIPDSVLDRAVAWYNAAGTTRISGTVELPAGNVWRGPQALYRGQFRIDGRVEGDVLVVNGDMRITASGVVTGSVTVLGGRLLVDAGGSVGGAQLEYPTTARLTLTVDGRLMRQAGRRALSDYTSASTTFTWRNFQTTLRANPGSYNRVEGFPVEFGPSVIWDRDDLTQLKFDLTGILRTASDPTDSRSTLGWRGSLAVKRAGAHPLTFGLRGGAVVAPVADRPYQTLETGLGAFFLRRDFRDWYAQRSIGVFAEMQLRPTVLASASIDVSRERSVSAVDAFSILRSGEEWRPNPLIDDGRYRTFAGGVTYDTRDDRRRPTSGWYVRSDLRYVTSGELTPVSLPVEIRTAMPTSNYDALEMDLDVRRYQRLGPTQSVHMRLTGGGWLAGNRLTIQRRRAMNGADPLAGYGFRAVNCDRRRRPDPALPALCDRQLAVQVEYRRTLDIDLSTRLGNTTIGLQRPDLVIFGDAGSAWLAGPGAGRVPSGRIQSIAEWRSDVGIGMDAGSFGLYLARALPDNEPIRFGIRFSRRF